MPEKPLSLAVPLARVWALATAAGLLAAALLFDAEIGVNLFIWTAVTGIGLLATRPADDPIRRTLLVPVGFALILSAGAAITADGASQAFIFLLVASLLALGTVLAATSANRTQYGALLILTAPIVALVATVATALRTVAVSVGSIDAVRRRPALRGALLSIPVALIFAALFADADPLFARGRDAIADLISSADVLPRVAFFVVVTLGVLGAYAFAATLARPAWATRFGTIGAPSLTVSGSERTIILGSAAAVSWLFVALQIGYLAVDGPSRAGSGVTYASYAHRGFGQLSVVATIALLLVVEALGRWRGTRAPARLRAAALALIAAVCGVLISAFHRVTLYESVYGFTTARIDAQTYMLVVLAVLVLCTIEIARGFDPARLARAAMVTTLVAIATLTLWNDEAWVVRQDVTRFAGTARLDVSYLTHNLSPDAYPALLDALPALPAPQRQELTTKLASAAACRLRGDTRWFEWNVRSARAREALLAHGFPAPAASVCTSRAD